jgi:hypothetical protein
MSISEKKLIANRLNAQKSTGPKTALGKFRSSRNALKHGFYSHFDIYRALEFLPRKAKIELLISLVKGPDPRLSKRRRRSGR